MYIEILALCACVLFAQAMLFQLAMVAGMPWGSLTLGGKYPGKFSNSLRILALLQLLLLALMAGIVLIRAGLLLPGLLDWSRTAIWFVVAYAFLGSVLNLLTSSKWERRIWAPVALLLLASCTYIAFMA